MIGVVEYDETGNPKCEVCGKYFTRVLSHVRQKHSMNEKEYKLKFGFDLYKGICSKESSERTRQKTLSNYYKCIEVNLKNKGSKTRFTNGHEGRTKDKVSQQTLNSLKERFKNPKIVELLPELGRKVGTSGLGNEKRWGKK